MNKRAMHGRNGLALVTAIGVAGFAGLALMAAPRLAGGVTGANEAPDVVRLQIPLAEAMTLQILNGSGRITVTECEGDSAEVSITREPVQHANTVDQVLAVWFSSSDEPRALWNPRVRRDSRGVQISALGLATADREPVSYHFDVKLPRGRNVEVSNGNGVIGVAGVEGDVLVHSDNGDVRCEDVTGSVSARVRNGAVFCRYVCGVVDVSAANGAIEVDAIPVQRHPVRAWTSNGAIKYRAPDTTVSLRAATDNGRIVSDLVASGERLDQTLRALDLNCDAATPEVELHALNGNIYLDAI